ncbi:hypothetical protein GGF32_000938 [Allomyces javanicus]|nr:hypothetical protein GGF32_000938 [Allomyces javanicus]
MITNRPRVPIRRRRAGHRRLVQAVTAVLVALCLAVTLAAAAQFKIAGVFPKGGGPTIQESLTVAQDLVNEYASSTGGGNHSFVLDFKDTNGTITGSSKAMFDAINDGAVAVIGDLNSDSTIPMALQSNNFKVWQCTGSVTTPLLGAKNGYPYFFRTIPDDGVQGVFLAQFVRRMGWRSIAVLFSSDAYGNGIQSTFQAEASKQGIQVTTTQTFAPRGGPNADYSIALNAILHSGTRIVLFVGYSFDFITIASRARKLGMIGNDWVWMGPDGISDLDDRLSAPGNKYSSTDRDNVNGVLFSFPVERGPKFSSFWDKYHAKFPSQTEVGHYGTLFADCYLALARGILKIAGAQGADVVTKRGYAAGTSLKDFLEPFDGVSGRVEFDSSGDRIAEMNMYNIYGGKANAVYTFPLGATTLTATSTPVKFYSGSSTPPPDRPAYLIAYVTYSSVGGIVIAAVNGLLILVVIGTTIYLYRERNHASVKQMSWPFLVQISVGVVMTLGAIFLWIGVPSKLSCNLQSWIFGLSLEITLSAVAAKAFRIWKVFDNKALLRLRNLSNARLFAGCGAIIGVQALIQLIWTLLAPLEPQIVASPTSIAYKCASKDATIDTVFRTISIVYNTLLLAAVLFLAYKTRRAFSQYRESKFQNIFLCGIIVTPLLYVPTDSWALGAFYVRTCIIMYSCIFSFGALVGRIALVPFLAHRKAAETGVRMVFEGMSSTDGTSSAEQMVGKPTTLQGKYPVKVANKLFETWKLHRLTLFALEGFLGLSRLTTSTEQGKLFKLRAVTFDPDPATPLCLELRADSTSYLVQFSTDEDKQTWIRALSVHCNVFSRAAGQSSSHHRTVQPAPAITASQLMSQTSRLLGHTEHEMTLSAIAPGAAMGGGGGPASAAVPPVMSPGTTPAGMGASAGGPNAVGQGTGHPSGQWGKIGDIVPSLK